jgi:hypothetical protein
MKSVWVPLVLLAFSGCATGSDPALSPPDRVCSALGIDANSVELHTNCEYTIGKPNDVCAGFRTGVVVCASDRIFILDQRSGKSDLKVVCALKYTDIDYLRADSHKLVIQVQLVSSGRLLVFSHVQGLASDLRINTRFYNLIASKGVRIGEKAQTVMPSSTILVPVG